MTNTNGVTSTTNMSFSPSPKIENLNVPSYKRSPTFTDEFNNLITSYRGFNSYFDADGFPVLFVINKNEKTYIFDKHGKKYTKAHSNVKGAYNYFMNNDAITNFYEGKQFVEKYSKFNQTGGTPFEQELQNSSREISILKVGCNLFHVITGSMIIEVDIALKSWDFFIPYNVISSTSIESEFLRRGGIAPLAMGDGRVEWKESFHSIVRDPLNESKYIIYFASTRVPISGEDGTLPPPYVGHSRPAILNSLKVDANSYQINYGTELYLTLPSLAYGYNSNVPFIAEFEVSPDGTKIAMNDRNNLLVYGINSTTKNVTTLVNHFNFSSLNGSDSYMISGLEFTASSNKLIFNRFNACNSCSLTSNNIGVWDYSIPSGVTYISSSGIAERGGLELGRDNNIYSVGPNSLILVNPVSMQVNAVSNTILTAGGASISFLNDIFNGVNFAIRPLPEQQDGQVFVSGGFHLDDDELIAGNNGLEFNNSSLPSSSSLRIRGEITINQTAGGVIPLKFVGITLNPATGTIVKIKSEARLELINCNIETNNCNSMWQGIVVENGGELNATNTSGTEKAIKDAIVGITVSGTNSFLNVSDYTFRRNERSIILNNASSLNPILGGPSTNIINNYFYNTDELKDYTKGQQITNLHKGISSIEINETGTNLNMLIIEGNVFQGGLFGIKSRNSFIEIGGCNFTDIKGMSEIAFFPRLKVNYASAIFAEKSDLSINKYVLVVRNNPSNNLASTFSENTRHITAYNGINLKVNSVSFSTSYQKGIEWVKNKGCSLEVLNSSFLNCANSSIYCDDNSFPSKVNLDRTYLRILGNTFSNDKYNLLGTENTPIFQYDANALMINDLGKTANTGYNHIEIASNQIYNLRTGLLVNGVTGGKTLLTEPENGGGIYNIDNNYPTIVRPTFNTIFPSGIHVINSNHLAAFQNDIIASNNQNRISNNGNAIYLENSSNISLKSNSLKGKYGIRAKMNNIGSEILCNTFSRNRFGLMYSDKHLLRNTFRTHGIKAVESRSNNYIQTGISDMHWIEPLDNVKNWWVIENNGTVKEGCYQAGTTKSCFGPFTPPGSSSPIFVFQTLIKDYAPDICKGQFPVGSPYEMDADTSSDQISQWELDFSYGLNDLITNPNYVLTDKIRIIKALEYAQTNIFDTALIFLNHNFENNLDQKYATLLKKYIGFSYPVAHQPDYTDEQYIRSIANKTPSIEGSHVYLARSIMQSLYDEQFSERDTAYADVHIELINTSCLQSTEELQVVMFNSFQDEIPIQYAFDNAFNLQIFGEGLNELNLATEYTIKVTHQSNEYQVTKTLFDLLNNENSIDLNCEINLGKRNSNLISKNDNISSLMVFPNPVNGILTIKGLNDDDQKCDIKVVDFLGRTIMEVDNQNGNNGLDLSNLNSGVYCLIIKNGSNNYKFIIQKQ